MNTELDVSFPQAWELLGNTVGQVYAPWLSPQVDQLAVLSFMVTDHIPKLCITDRFSSSYSLSDENVAWEVTDHHYCQKTPTHG